MSVEHLAAVLHHSRAQGTVKIVLLGIANHAGDGGSWPSLRTLAVYANVDVRTVRRSLRRLEELGEIATATQAGGDHRHRHPYERPNLYEVLVGCPPGCDGSPNHRARAGYKRQLDGTYERLAPVDNPPTDPRTPVSPPDTGVPSPEDSGVPQTINQTVDNHRGLSTTGRARARGRLDETLAEATVTAAEAGTIALLPDPCLTCSAPNELTCLRRQLKLSTGDRHAYDNGHARDVGGSPDDGVTSAATEEGDPDGR